MRPISAVQAGRSISRKRSVCLACCSRLEWGGLLTGGLWYPPRKSCRSATPLSMRTMQPKPYEGRFIASPKSQRIQVADDGVVANCLQGTLGFEYPAGSSASRFRY